MKPVEIEFIMRDKLSPGIDKAGKSAETLGDKAEQVSKSITDRIAAQKEQIKYVESCLKDLKKQYDNLAPGKAQLEMRAEIDACTKALQEDKNILSSLEAEHDKASVSTKRLSMQLREMQDAMARLRLEGKQNTKEYAEMADKAAVLADTIGDLRTQTNILANDDAALQGVMSGVNGLSGLFTTATGVMGIFASENEDLIKIQTRRHYGAAASHEYPEQGFRFSAGYRCQDEKAADGGQYKVGRVIGHLQCGCHRFDGHPYAGAFRRYNGAYRALG